MKEMEVVALGDVGQVKTAGYKQPGPTTSHLLSQCEDFRGPFLNVCHKDKLGLHGADKRTFYLDIVKTINGLGPLNRAATGWTERLGAQRPRWRTLYTSPIKNRTGDLQWRILHGVIATTFICFKLQRLHVCPFCGLSQTVFTERSRLTGFSSVLSELFNHFNLASSALGFIGGTAYKKAEHTRCQVLNFVIGRAKPGVGNPRLRHRMRLFPPYVVALDGLGK